MFCDNLEKELKIQDELFEQQLQKHYRLAINETKLLEQQAIHLQLHIWYSTLFTMEMPNP
uniref:Uncharacterized protein n=1 Tax=Romanomermis culicivorax TaxID=13658 RepID=A0A915IXH0_ROMCU